MPDAERFRLALAQSNPTVGDIPGNVALAIAEIEAAQRAGAAAVVLPELALTGYPPEDLLLKRHFVEAARAGLEQVAAACGEIVALIGLPLAEDERLYNALAVVSGGSVHGFYRKTLLPNYGVFDERRYFDQGQTPALIEIGSVRIGLTICEDVWFGGSPAADLAAAGASLILNASASPYYRAKGMVREEIVAARARETGAVVALCNTVGGQDELVFDGHSVVVGPDGETLARAAQFAPELLICDLDLPTARPAAPPEDSPARLLAVFDQPAAPGTDLPSAPIAAPLEPLEEIYEALVLGLRDYAQKNAFRHVVVALSGGIDSALVAVLAADAFGPEHLTCVTMPSPHSSEGTLSDAHAIARNLGSELIEIPIEPAMSAYDVALADPFADRGEVEPGLAEENIQARIRGNLIMALSNKFGWLVLTTGNKSEMAVGYATLYGDMAGGFAAIKDVPKMLVYELSEYRNRTAEGRAPVPRSVLDRPPSAELRPDQQDSDSLPPYHQLDRILEGYVEQDLSAEQIAEQGIPLEVVREIIRLVDRSEYKRRQAPPGTRITSKAFGRDRRMPITNRFSG